jgi:carbamoyl-phosphate synthase large subunit
VREKHTILVTAIGSFSAGAVIRKCRENGDKIIGTDIYPQEWLAEGNEVDRFYQIPRSDAGEDYVKALENIIKTENVTHLIPLTDAEIDVLNGKREALAPAVLCISPEKAVSVLRNKKKCASAVKKVLAECCPDGSVRTIPSKTLKNLDFDTIAYPLVIKPVNGRSSEGLHIVRNEDQLGFAIAEAENAEGAGKSEELLVQPMIKGHVVTVDLVRDSRGNCVAVPREELLRTLNGAGTSVRIYRDPVLEEACRKIAEYFGILGCVNMEFIHGEGSGIYYFLECNPRFSGGTAFTCEAGYDTVTNHMKVFENAEISTDNGVSEGYLVKKYVEVKTKQ